MTNAPAPPPDTRPAPRGVLYQKARQAQDAQQSDRSSPARAFQVALERVGATLWGLAIQAQDCRSDRLAQGQALAAVDGEDLLLVFGSPTDGVAVAAVPPSVLAALTEVQTLGVVNDRPVQPRAFTDTDAAIVWLYLEHVLPELSRRWQDPACTALTRAPRLIGRAETPHRAGLALDVAQVWAFSAALDIGQGAKTGLIRVFIPIPDPGPTRAEHRPTAPKEFGFHLLPMPLTVVLGPNSIPLSVASRLKAGDRLPLAPHLLGQVQVRAGGGHQVATAKLGKLNGFRAVRVDLPTTSEKPDQADTEEPQVPETVADPPPAPEPLPQPVPEPEQPQPDTDDLPVDLSLDDWEEE